MSEPMQLQGIFLATMSAALVVLSGALYALFFALGQLRNNRALSLCGWLSYAVLVVCSMVLADSLDLAGFWTGVIVIMLLGYLLLPQAIWHLCVGTHAGDGHEQSHESPSASPGRAIS